MPSISYIVQKMRVTVFLLFSFAGFFLLPHEIHATEVLKIQIDPASPVYNQPFKCALTLDQDDHRNACDLLPLDAPADMEPWDICRIDHLSNNNLTRHYNCIANTARKVPGPGSYQIVVWNFVGDGESGQITARQNITILAAPPPPTATPKPSPTLYVPPTNIPPPTSLPTSSPTQYNQPTRIPSSIVRPTQSLEYPAPFSPSTNALSPTPFPSPSFRLFDVIESSIASYLSSSILQTKQSVFAPLWNIISRFLEETHF